MSRCESGRIIIMYNLFKTILMFAPCFLLNHLFMSFIRNDGSPQLSMCMMIVGSLTNMILDYLFMYPFHMGLLGPALATGLAPTMSVIIAMIYILLKRNQFHFTKISFHLSQMKAIIEPGLSSFINELSFGIVLVVFNLLILKFAGNIGGSSLWYCGESGIDCFGYFYWCFTRHSTIIK